jgi:hypothetical protein
MVVLDVPWTLALTGTICSKDIILYRIYDMGNTAVDVENMIKSLTLLMIREPTNVPASIDTRIILSNRARNANPHVSPKNANVGLLGDLNMSIYSIEEINR